MISEIESAIVLAIKAAMPKSHIELFPDSPENYQLINPAGAILVAYKGRSSESITDCLAESKLDFVITFLYRNLRQRDAHQGVYEALEQVEAALKNGLPDGTALTLERERFISRDSGNGQGGVWQYAQMWTVKQLN